MARPKKNVVDYFPHYCVHKKTLFILEQRFGNNGYAFWFKLLEELGQRENHYIDTKNEAELEFLGAKTRLLGVEITEILNLLAKLGTIDQELWTNGVIWCANFVDNLKEVYANRSRPLPTKPVIGGDNRVVDVVSTPRNDTEVGVSTAENPQSRVEESKVNNTTSNNLRNGETVNCADGTVARLWYGKFVDNQNPSVVIDIGYYPELKKYLPA